MRSITVQIPRPCHENWNDMKPAEHGRFCAGCQATVVDYTAFSDQELITLLSKPLSTTCGRFRKEQLDRPLIPAPPATSLWRQWLGVLTMGLLSWQTARAQLSHSGKPLAASPAKTDYAVATIPIRNAIGGSFSTVVFTGKVVRVDSNNNVVPAAQATVFVQRAGGNWQTQTDSSGTFNLAVSIPMEVTPLTVTAFAPGYVHHRTTVDATPAATTISLNSITLEKQSAPVVITGGGLIIIQEPSRWQKLKRKLFR